MAVKSTKVTGPGLKPDARYDSTLVSKFINCMMYEGKKSVAERVFYGALDIVAKKLSGEEPLHVFKTAVSNVKPHIEVRSRRVGGQNYQVPVPVKENRQLSLSIRWILSAARAKKGKSMSERLANELVDAFKREGSAMQSRENVHRMAEANKAFAHYGSF